MCGRYALKAPVEAARSLGVESVPRCEPRFNIAPSQESLIVVPSETGSPRALLARWGFAASAGSRARRPRLVINARSEDVARRPLFRESLAKRRCLVPASGFYEWRAIGRSRQPYYFSLPDSSPISFAGLWNLDALNRPTFVIMTTEANEVVAPVHGRMPVLLNEDQCSLWLDAQRHDPATARKALLPWPGGALASWPVSMRVNDPGTDDEGCIEPLEGPVDLFMY